MFIAHWPAGYLCACAREHFKVAAFSAARQRSLFWALLVGSVFPDVDMIYFYFIDHRQHHHHLYLTHLPFFWLCLYAVALGFSLLSKRREIAAISTAFVAGIFLHLLLDTPMGGVAWLYPLSAKLFYFVEVPSSQSWWFLSFVLHWSFLSELAICLAALWLFLRRRKVPHKHDQD